MQGAIEKVMMDEEGFDQEKDADAEEEKEDVEGGSEDQGRV